MVTLPENSNINKTLEEVNQLLLGGRETDVIIDFSRIEVITSSTISNLCILRDLVNKCDRKLVLCHLSMPTKCEFRVMGIEDMFTFAEDKYSAINLLQAKTASSD
ncbi:MAG: hypothetical protein E4H40_06025 [Candidatus Brocadiia bacterium]|nr:MAG: hypothetical protein E4H40_06025 [Candidatus Brocadiia bacterium]